MHNWTPAQCAINNSPSSKFQADRISDLFQLITRPSTDFDKLPNSTLQQSTVSKRQPDWVEKHLYWDRHICCLCQDLRTFSSKEIMRDSLHMRDHAMLKELGIKMMGDMLAILKLTKEPPVSLANHVKPPTAKLPQLNPEMTPQQFQKFRIDWDVFTKLTNLCPL